MTRRDLAEFRFARDWIHAGTRYAAGDTARLPPATVAMLTELGAGDVPAKHSRRTARSDGSTRNTSPTGE